MAKKVALGKGMASLIQAPATELLSKTLTSNEREDKQKQKAEAKIINNDSPFMVDVNQIKPNSAQPRKIFKEKELLELSESIKENGIIQPLIVIKTESGFELIAGERRLRASKMAGITQVPVVIKRATEKEKTVMAIIENVQRSDLNCVEEALAYYQLMTDYDLTQEEVAKKIGKERSTIANFLRILKLPKAALELVQKDLLTFGHAKILAAVKERDRVLLLATTAVEQRLSVRDLEKLIKKKVSKISEEKTPTFFESKLDQFKQNLEKRTGFHFDLKAGKSGNGTVTIKFNNEAEFNDVYEFLLKR